MTKSDQIKILNNKIKANNALYDINRLNAEISAFSEGDLDKYLFLTRKDLKYKPNALDKAKFGFSPLGKAFNQGLDKKAENYKEEGIIKLLKDIRDRMVTPLVVIMVEMEIMMIMMIMEIIMMIIKIIMMIMEIIMMIMEIVMMIMEIIMIIMEIIIIIMEIIMMIMEIIMMIIEIIMMVMMIMMMVMMIMMIMEMMKLLKRALLIYHG